MNQNKARFYSIWIILGFTISYSLKQFLSLLHELIINGGIFLNLNPDILKYCKSGFWGIVCVLIIIYSIKVIRDNKTDLIVINYKKLRKTFLIATSLGIISQILSQIVRIKRPDNLDLYLRKHEMNIFAFYPTFMGGSVFPYIAIFITIITVFLLITRNE